MNTIDDVFKVVDKHYAMYECGPTAQEIATLGKIERYAVSQALYELLKADRIKEVFADYSDTTYVPVPLFDAGRASEALAGTGGEKK